MEWIKFDKDDPTTYPPINRKVLVTVCDYVDLAWIEVAGEFEKKLYPGCGDFILASDEWADPELENLKAWAEIPEPYKED